MAMLGLLPSQSRHKFGPIRVSARNRLTLEFRQHYPLAHEGARPRPFRATFYFFFPPSFGLGPDSWHPDHYYQSSQHFLTYDATSAALDRLGNSAHPDNLLQTLNTALSSLLETESAASDDLVKMARLFSSELADALNAGARDLQAIAASGPGQLDRLQRDSCDYCRRAEASLDALRRLRRRAMALVGVVPPEFLATLSFAEDYVTAVMCEAGGEVVQTIIGNLKLRDGTRRAALAKATLVQSLDRVENFRRRRGFADPRRDGEYYSYRMGLLKKELQQSTYLQTQSRQSDPLITNTAAMVAAGLAATWASLANLRLLNMQVSLRGSLFFFALAIGAYILKDRIKEWVKFRLATVWRRWDVNTKFRGVCSVHGRLKTFRGNLAARARWMSPAAIPVEIRKLRGVHRNVNSAALGLERVLCYTQSCRLDDSIQGVAGQGIKETLRVSIGDLLGRLDDPEDQVPCLDANTRSVAPISVPRVYHLNVIHVAIDESNGQKYFGRARVVVNRQGIVRVEQVSTGQQALPPSRGDEAAHHSAWADQARA